MEFEKLKKKFRPTHTRETGSGKGKQKYFYGWSEAYKTSRLTAMFGRFLLQVTL